MNEERLDNFFKLSERGTDIRTEILAGITIFVTMAYVLAVQPSAIVGFGGENSMVDINGLLISKSAILVSCAIISGFVNIAMGLYANIPMALSTSMGSNFILGALINTGEVSFGWTMAILLCSGTIFILITIFNIRSIIVDMLPANLKIAMSTAVGFFVAHLGFNSTGIASFENGLSLGDFTQTTVLLAVFGILLMAALTAHKVRGSILIGIIVTTIVGIPLGVTSLPSSIIGLPRLSEVRNLMFSYDFNSIFNDLPRALIWIYVLFVSDFFGTLSCLMAVGGQTGMLDEEGNFPDIHKPFLVDAVGTVVGSATGNTTISTFIETSAGVQSGGRTGLTSVVVGILFFISIFFSPLFLIIPSAATGGALIFVGMSMLNNFRNLDFSDFTVYFGPVLTITLIAFTGDIAAGVAAGILIDVFIKVVTGKYKEVPVLLYIMCIPLLFYFIV